MTTNVVHPVQHLYHLSHLVTSVKPKVCVPYYVGTVCDLPEQLFYDRNLVDVPCSVAPCYCIWRSQCLFTSGTTQCFDAKDLIVLHSVPAFFVSLCKLVGFKEAGMWFRHLGSPTIEQHSQSLGTTRCRSVWCLSASVHYSRDTSLSLWVCERLWHASVNTVHIRHCEPRIRWHRPALMKRLGRRFVFVVLLLLPARFCSYCRFVRE